MAEYPKYVKAFATLDSNKNTTAGPDPSAKGVTVNMYDIIQQGINDGDIDVTGPNAGAAVTIDGAQTITGAKTFSAVVTANAGLAGGASADITLNTDKFTVDATQGNTVVAGTLTVQGTNVTAASATTVNLAALQEFADDAAAGGGGLAAGDVYRTATGELRIKL